MRTSTLMFCLVMMVVWPAAACAQAQPPLPPAQPAPPPRPPRPPQPELQHERSADEAQREAQAAQRGAAAAQLEAAAAQRAAAADARADVDGALKLKFQWRGAAVERPALVVTEPVSPDVEAQWKEDLRVMDKLLDDQLSPARLTLYPQAMGIKLMSLGQSEPTYIEGLGCLFTCRVGFPLAEGSGGGTTQPAPAAQPSAWDRAKRELSGHARGEHPDLLLQSKAPRMSFDQAALDRLIEGIIKVLPEATNIRHLPPEQFVVVTVLGTDDGGAPMRLTMKAKKSDIDQAAKGTISPEDFARRVARRVR